MALGVSIRVNRNKAGLEAADAAVRGVGSPDAKADLYSLPVRKAWVFFVDSDEIL